MQPAEILAAIDEVHGLKLTLGERYERGEQGAFQVEDASGTRLVLKWGAGLGARERVERARLTTEHLREKGYPAPRYVADGVIDGNVYSLQEVLPGRPMGTIEVQHLPRLFELNDLQRGPSRLPDSAWPRIVVDSVMVGLNGYCVLASLEEYSDATRRLLHGLQSRVLPLAQYICQRDEIVHFDFNPVNVLVEDGQISGVVDWDGAIAGDRSFDIVTLLFYAGSDPAVREALWDHLSRNTTLDVVSLYLAHMIVRQLDWTIRHYDADAVQYWIEVAERAYNELISR